MGERLRFYLAVPLFFSGCTTEPTSADARTPATSRESAAVPLAPPDPPLDASSRKHDRLGAAGSTSTNASTDERPVEGEPRTDGSSRVILRGVLRMTKGYRGMLQGHVISRKLLHAHLGEEWEKRAVGRQMYAVAITKTHHCGPEEQCLMEGRIPYVLRFEVLRRPLSGEPCGKIQAKETCVVPDDYCVLDMGEPCGASTSLHCRDGLWQRQEEANLCP